MKLAPGGPTLRLDDAATPAERSVFQDIITQFQRIANAVNNPDHGTTAARPTTQLVIGQTYFDTTLGKPIWWSAAANHWVDATGTNV